MVMRYCMALFVRGCRFGFGFSDGRFVFLHRSFRHDPFGLVEREPGEKQGDVEFESDELFYRVPVLGCPFDFRGSDPELRSDVLATGSDDFGDLRSDPVFADDVVRQGAVFFLFFISHGREG